MQNAGCALRRLGFFVAMLSFAGGAEAQFIPYYGKNKVKYDNFAWRIYKSPHFEVYYYPEFEQHLSRVVSYAESAYQKVSSDLKHEISFPIPLILYKTSSEFQQTNLYPDFVPEGVLAFAEPVRDRMVLPIDEPPDMLYGLIVHELTHVFEFDIIPRSLIQRTIPLWVDEGLADYERGVWDPIDLANVRDAAVTDQVPRLSRLNELEAFTSGRLPYNLGHAAFEFIEARYGKEGIRQFLYTLRKNIVGGGLEDIYQQAFRIKPEEFDQQFEKWLKERFKPFRDKQRPTDYGTDLSPDSEKTPYTQVFAFAPSPSGEIIAAVTGNRADGEWDLVLLSVKDGSVIRNLTKGFSGEYEYLNLNLSARAFGRSIAFDPKGDTVAFFARTGKRRSLFLVSVLNGKTVRKVPIELDEAHGPCLLPDGKHAIFGALKEGVADIYLLDLDTGLTKNLTQDSFADSNPQISPDGKLVVYSRRVSGHEKLYTFPLDNPDKKTQLSFGSHHDVTPTFSPDGNLVYYTSNEDDEIYNLRSIDLRTGVIKQYTDSLGGDMMPAPIPGKGPERLAFVTYFKGEYLLHDVDLLEPLKEVDQEVRAADEEVVDFQPDVIHQVVAENKRKKRVFEKLFLEGRPPLNVMVTSSGDFFGGSQVALSDVLGDQNFLFTAYSLREFRTYEGAYINLGKRLHYGFTGFDSTAFYFPTYYIPNQPYSRDGALFTSRFTGGSIFGQYPLDKFRRLEFGAGLVRIKQQYENPFVEQEVSRQLAATGQDVFYYNGTYAPLSVGIVQETTRFREFGPMTGSTFALSLEFAPAIGGLRSRTTLDGDLRKYLRLGSTSSLLAFRARGFHSFGDSPSIQYFGGNMEMRGYQYLSFAGHTGFFANAEFRVPLVHAMATPLGVLGPIRGTLFAGAGGARFKGQPFQFASRKRDLSFVNDPFFGEPVSGLHLVDGRASFGFGLQFFFLGYPLHFDWTKFTDLKVTSRNWKFDFWVGFDF
jgi:Tol biopolymer transport system component